MKKDKEMSIEERRNYWGNWAKTAFSKHEIKRLTPNPVDGNDAATVFQCKEPGTNNLMFTVSFLPYSIHVDGDVTNFTICSYGSYGMHWLLTSRDMDYIISKSAHIHQEKVFVPGEVPTWLQEIADDLAERGQGEYVEHIKLLASHEGTDSEDNDLDSFELSDEWQSLHDWYNKAKELWEEFLNEHEPITPAIDGHAWMDMVCQNITDFETEDLDSWNDWSDDTLKGYHLLMVFKRLYKSANP